MPRTGEFINGYPVTRAMYPGHCDCCTTRFQSEAEIVMIPRAGRARANLALHYRLLTQRGNTARNTSQEVESVSAQPFPAPDSSRTDGSVRPGIVYAAAGIPEPSSDTGIMWESLREAFVRRNNHRLSIRLETVPFSETNLVEFIRIHPPTQSGGYWNHYYQGVPGTRIPRTSSERWADNHPLPEEGAYPQATRRRAARMPDAREQEAVARARQEGRIPYLPASEVATDPFTDIDEVAERERGAGIITVPAVQVSSDVNAPEHLRSVYFLQWVRDTNLEYTQEAAVMQRTITPLEPTEALYGEYRALYRDTEYAPSPANTLRASSALPLTR